jgi:hypothetical protein
MHGLLWYLWVGVVGTAATITFLILLVLSIAIIFAIFIELFFKKAPVVKVVKPIDFPDLKEGHDVLDKALSKLDTNLKVIEAESRGFKIYRG